ncbi:putative efflux transporter protein [metagenome]|uniref:Putative efflux transporter protein n=1 Tax=metagenome TaxID=256318 RepID=A0A2P2CC67_9ZZZZ
MTARRSLYGWLAAEAISLTGTRISMIAIPLLVLAETGSATRTGLVAFAEALPLVLLKVLSGPVIDRVGARRVAIACDLGSVVAVGCLPLLYDAGLLSFPALLALVALAGALRGPGDAAKQALVPRLVSEAGVPMERATGLGSTVERSASMLGAAAAGVLVGVVGPANALLVDAVSFGLSAAVLAWAIPRTGATAQEADPQEGSYLRRLHEGWAFLRSDRVLLGITVMVALTNLLDAAWLTVLLPVWAVESGSGARVGLLLAVFSAAAALGAVCAATWAERLPRYHVYLVAFLIAGAPRFVVMALDARLGVILAVGAAAGFSAGFINPVLGAVIFERIPEPLVGRVSSLGTALCWSLIPAGGLVGGLLIGGVGLSAALLACGAAYFLVTTLPALDPRWRELDERPAAEVEPDKPVSIEPRGS